MFSEELLNVLRTVDLKNHNEQCKLYDFLRTLEEDYLDKDSIWLKGRYGKGYKKSWKSIIQIVIWWNERGQIVWELFPCYTDVKVGFYCLTGFVYTGTLCDMFIEENQS